MKTQLHSLLLLLLVASVTCLTACDNNDDSDDDDEAPSAAQQYNVQVAISDDSFVKSGDAVFQFDTAEVTFSVSTEDAHLVKGFVISSGNQVIKPFKVKAPEGLVLLNQSSGFVKTPGLQNYTVTVFFMTSFVEETTDYSINLLDDADVFNARVLASMPFEVEVKTYIDILTNSPHQEGSTIDAGDTIRIKARIYNPDHKFNQLGIAIQNSSGQMQSIRVISMKDAAGQELSNGTFTTLFSQELDSLDVDIMVETPFADQAQTYVFRLGGNFFFPSMDKRMSVVVQDPTTAQNTYLREFNLSAQGTSFPGGFANIAGNEVYRNNSFVSGPLIDFCYGVATFNNGFFPSLLSFKERTLQRGFSFPAIPADAKDGHFKTSFMTARQFYTSSDATLANLSVSTADPMIMAVNKGQVLEIMTTNGKKGLVLVQSISTDFYPQSLNSLATVRVKVQK